MAIQVVELKVLKRVFADLATELEQVASNETQHDVSSALYEVAQRFHNIDWDWIVNADLNDDGSDKNG